MGLRNLGNSCYIGSVMQCIYHVPFLLDLWERSSVNAQSLGETALVAAFLEVLRKMKKAVGAVSIARFKQSVDSCMP